MQGWTSRRGILFVSACAILLGFCGESVAQNSPLDNPLLPDEGKLPLTAGFTDIDGAGGGGLVPWALITGYGTAQSWGANAHVTEVPLRDFSLLSYGLGLGVLDRFEVSAAHSRLEATGTALDGLTVEQQTVGLKVKLTGNAVYDQDSWLPQTAVGLEYKRNTGISSHTGLVSATALGASSASGTDYYVSASKILLAESILVNLTLRYTDANQFGLLGFGGPDRRSRSVEPEATVAYLLSRTLAVGVEYRDRPHNLAVDDEKPAWDSFLAWTIDRHVSLVAAYADLGSILGAVTHDMRTQNGAYISLQVGF